MSNITLPVAVDTPVPAPKMSSRYVHINTRQVLNVLAEEGFEVAGVMSVRPRAADPLYARHAVDLRHPDMPKLGDGVPRIVFSNSHDGSARASVMAGVFRFVCTNGMVVGSTYANERVVHAGESARTLIDRIRHLARNTAPLFKQIESWQRKQLTDAAAREYARLAATLRWGDPHRFEPEQLLEVRRADDEGNDLWRVFNRVQEATTRLKLPGVARSGRATRSAPLNELSANLRFNQQLWQLTEEFAGA
jgi:hypothetical protein